MNEKLEVQQVAVKQKSEACDALLEDITTKTELVILTYNTCICTRPPERIKAGGGKFLYIFGTILHDFDCMCMHLY